MKDLHRHQPDFFMFSGLYWVLSSAMWHCCQFVESHLQSWQLPGRFASYQETPFANSLIKYYPFAYIGNFIWWQEMSSLGSVSPIVWQFHWDHLHIWITLGSFYCNSFPYCLNLSYLSPFSLSHTPLHSPSHFCPFIPVFSSCISNYLLYFTIRGIYTDNPAPN